LCVLVPRETHLETRNLLSSRCSQCAASLTHRALESRAHTQLDRFFAGYVKQMTALAAVDPETGESSLVLNHSIHPVAPIEYNRDGTVAKEHDFGRPNDIDKRFTCWSNTHSMLLPGRIA